MDNLKVGDVVLVVNSRFDIVCNSFYEGKYGRGMIGVVEKVDDSRSPELGGQTIILDMQEPCPWMWSYNVIKLMAKNNESNTD